MIHKNLLDILVRQSFTRQGDAFSVGPGHSCSVYLSYGDESLILDRVVTVEVAAEVAVLTTARRERFAVELGEIRCVRVTPEVTGPGYRG